MCVCDLEKLANFWKLKNAGESILGKETWKDKLEQEGEWPWMFNKKHRLPILCQGSRLFSRGNESYGHVTARFISWRLDRWRGWGQVVQRTGERSPFWFYSRTPNCFNLLSLCCEMSREAGGEGGTQAPWQRHTHQRGAGAQSSGEEFSGGRRHQTEFKMLFLASSQVPKIRCSIKAKKVNIFFLSVQNMRT